MIALVAGVALVGCGSRTQPRGVAKGAFESVVTRGGVRIEIRVAPNRVGVLNRFRVRVVRDERALRRARVVTTLTMLGMPMGEPTYALGETAPGVYTHTVPALVMSGRWRLSFSVAPHDGDPLSVEVVDRVDR